MGAPEVLNGEYMAKLWSQCGNIDAENVWKMMLKGSQNGAEIDAKTNEKQCKKYWPGRLGKNRKTMLHAKVL